MVVQNPHSKLTLFSLSLYSSFITVELPELEIELSSRDTDSILIGWGPLDSPIPDQETIYVITAETESGAVAAIDTVLVGKCVMFMEHHNFTVKSVVVFVGYI